MKKKFTRSWDYTSTRIEHRFWGGDWGFALNSALARKIQSFRGFEGGSVRLFEFLGFYRLIFAYLK